jgi:AmiR/NasT family two-component response regulator
VSTLKSIMSTARAFDRVFRFKSDRRRARDTSPFIIKPEQQLETRKLTETLQAGNVDLVVCEHTGKYEQLMVSTLHDNDIPVHCAQPRNEQEMAELVESEPSIKHPIETLTNEHGVGLISAITIYAATIVRFNTLLKVMYQEPQVNPVAS